MQTLPPEVFLGLLEYLPYRDRKSLSETSAYFNQLCLDHKYLDKEQIVFEGCVLSPETSPLDILLKRLKTLHLGFCFEITDITLHHGIKFLELRDLDLSCCNITDDGLRVLSENNPSIEELNLSGCHTITDEGLKSLQNLHRLRRLSLKNIKQITADGVLTMRRNCKSLQYLDASQCDLNLGVMDLGSSTSSNPEGFLYFQPLGTFSNSCPRWQNDTLIHQSDSPSSMES
ncbi:dynein regulatory complex subunit 6 isoform X4 [Nilaparvata lugens]|uniref:dynein regulatory complex subunit 6 isoform X4 n=1 Tax=Nilaparvata lugens TaxID=108931 RepID=UPI00193D64E6|nr:dynein regulatory complex subunit 6 isoform X4 [Nilaparvata lugens]